MTKEDTILTLKMPQYYAEDFKNTDFVLCHRIIGKLLSGSPDEISYSYYYSSDEPKKESEVIQQIEMYLEQIGTLKKTKDLRKYALIEKVQHHYRICSKKGFTYGMRRQALSFYSIKENNLLREILYEPLEVSFERFRIK